MFKKQGKNRNFIWMAFLASGLAGFSYSQETPDQGAVFNSENTDILLHVDNRNPKASDAGKGTDESKPYMTISRALEEAERYLGKGESVKISIAGGEYSESCQLDVPKSSKKMLESLLVIEGKKDAEVILTGLTESGFQPGTWRLVAGETNIYEHPLAVSYGLYQSERAANWAGKIISGTGMRREMIYVDGKRLDPVELDIYEWVDHDGPEKYDLDPDSRNKQGDLKYQGISSEKLEVLEKDWTYAVCDHMDAPEDYRNKIFLRLPEGTYIHTLNSIQVGRNTEEGYLLKISNKNNLILRNLTLRHSCSHLDEGALQLLECANILLEDCNIIDNYGTGANIMVDNITINRCRINGNGGKGLGRRMNNSLILDTEFCFNVWRAAAAGYVNYDTGGIKIGQQTKSVILRRCIAVGNMDHGFWHDVHTHQIRYENCFAYGNAGSGFFFEYSGKEENEGDDYAESCIAARNDAGFHLSDVRKPAIRNCLALNNNIGIRLRETPRIPATAEEFVSHECTGNTVISQEGKPMVTVANPDEMMPTFIFSKNKYFSSQPEQAFRIKDDLCGLDKWKSKIQSYLPSGANDSDASMETVPDISKAMDFKPGSEIAKKAQQMKVPVPLDYLEKAEEQLKNMEMTSDK